MKIVHLADVHIRLFKYHEQYRVIFKELYEKVKALNPDCIIFCGDLVHNKITISNEGVILATEFLKNLADIADTYIILGNHDFNVKNDGRIDSITPIVTFLNHPKLHFLKYSQQVDIGNDFVLNVCSIADRENWSKPKNTNKVNIGLGHFPIIGALTDTNWVVDSSYVDLDLLSDNDYCMLGDLHRSNQIIDENGRVRYAGSCMQQNFSEDVVKGFLVWNIENKENFTCDFVSLNNPSPFLTISLDERGNIPNDLNIKPGSRIRVITYFSLSSEKIKKTIDKIKQLFNPESVVFLNKSTVSKTELSSTLSLSNENMRDESVQERMIRDFLFERDIKETDPLLNRVLELNRKYKIVDAEEIARNVFWKIKSASWDNLYNYGEGNRINFENLKGIVGIFGPSYSGKTGAICNLLYTIFNTSSKNIRKNFNIINQNRDWGKGSVELECNNKTFSIQRYSEKYERKLHGLITEEAKTTVEFSSIDKNEVFDCLNGTERSDTDNNIRKQFGTVEDFMLTSFSSQFGSLSFVEEGATKRKEILAKFLDLEIFDKKCKAAKEEYASIKSLLKKLEGKEYDKEIRLVEYQLEKEKDNLENQKNSCLKYKGMISDCENELEEVKNKIKSMPNKTIDIAKVTSELASINKKIKDNGTLREQLLKTLNERVDSLEKVKQFLEEKSDIEQFLRFKEEINTRTETLKEIANEIKDNANLLKINQKKTDLLKEVPCSSEFSHCRFIRDAYEAKATVKELENKLVLLENRKQEEEKKIELLNPDRVLKYIDNYNKVLSKKNTLELDIHKIQANIDKVDITVLQEQRNISELQKIINEYEENREVIENFALVQKTKDLKEKELKNVTLERDNCENTVLNLYKSIGSLEQKIIELQEQKKELLKLREECAAYELFVDCFHPDGISYEIIKKKLSFINDEISKILINIVNFKVFFVANEKKLDIMIQHEKYEPRPLEMGSGAEKAISALAIRLALIKICSLPKSNILVLDEPMVQLDSGLLDNFVKMLEILKQEFDTVIIISHLEELKGAVDSEIVIQKVNGYAYVNQ